MKPFTNFTFMLLSLCFLLGISGCQTPEAAPAFSHDGRRVIAYWHNWKSAEAAFLPLEEVPPAVNTLIVAFALPENKISGRMTFTPHETGEEEFTAQIRELQRRGVDVLISVGGGNHPVELNKSWMKTNFVSTMQNIIDTYGFDGIDINLEGSSKVLTEEDTDFENPTTPKVLHLIEAVRELKTHYGEDFLLAVTPETRFLVNGYDRYGGGFGGYLPFLDALRDEIDLVQMQLYNSGSQYVYTGEALKEGGVIVEQGTADFVVGLTEMVIRGFPVGRDPDKYFEGMGAEKVVVGLPALPAAAGGGAMDAQEFRRAMGYLMTGKADYDSGLKLREPGGYPKLAGVMTWSVNWDATTGGDREAFAFLNLARDLLRELVPLK